MRRFSSCVVVVLVGGVIVGVIVGVGGCQPGRAPLVPPCETTAGAAVGATAFDQLFVPTTRFEVLLGEEVGGPLLCAPGTGDCAACEGDEFDVVVGESVTVAVDMLNSADAFPVPVTVVLTGGSDPAFQLLEPLPTTTSSDGPTPVFVGIAPVDVGVIDAFLSFTATATNTSGKPPLLVGLHVNAIAP